MQELAGVLSLCSRSQNRASDRALRQVRREMKLLRLRKTYQGSTSTVLTTTVGIEDDRGRPW
jgi:hypothetical protein